jgi:serine/threonine protein kinase
MPTTFKVIIQHSSGEVVSQYSLDPGEHNIGRDVSNSVSAQSDYLSRHHARLILAPNGISIEDLGSTHGTHVNGEAIQSITGIALNQAVQIGDLYLTVQDDETSNINPDLYTMGDLIGGGRYTLRQEIGRGGDGIVWLANDEHLAQLVAIKRLPPELANNTIALRDLVSEVQKARMLSHPNIVRIHDFVKSADEPPFITMEFVDGSDLNSLRSQQPNGYFTWERLEGLAGQLCESLEYAHQQQIIHRDLKPANMMITRDGNLKLADFGIAASMGDSGSQKQTEGDSSGTMVYMSPQQMQGATPHPTDDIYALGATLYDLLTTRPPFYTGDIFHLAQEVPPPTLSQRLSDFEMEKHVPPHVENAIMACLSKDPASRPANATELAALLHPSDQPPPPPPPPPEFIPEMESILAEPLEKTQKYLEENLPAPVTSWWNKQNTNRRDFALIACIVIGLIAAELIYSGLTKKWDLFKTIRDNEWGLFRPW